MSGGGSDVNAHSCWQIVNPKIDMATHQTGSWLARSNKEGGVNWISTPPCQEGQAYFYLPDMEYSHPQDEGPLPPVEGWLPTLYQRQ